MFDLATVLTPYQIKAIKYAAALHIPDGLHNQRFGDIWRSWQMQLLADIYATYNPITGERWLKEFLVLVPKKNGKSTFAAALALCFLLLNERDYNEGAIIAPTKKIAKNSFKPMCAMIDKDKYLKKRFKVKPTTKEIYDYATKTEFSIVAADTSSVSGSLNGFVIYDELWKLTENSDIQNILIEGNGGLKAKPEAFALYITTMSDKPPTIAFSEYLKIARLPKEEQYKMRFYSMLFEPKNRDIPIDEITPDLIKEVNPNLGLTVFYDDLLTDFHKAKNKGGDAFLAFLSKHLNIEIKPQDKKESWAGVEFWQRQSKEFNYSDILNECETVIIAIDGGGLDDLIGISVQGRVNNSNRWLVHNTAICTKSALHKNDTYEIYQKFIKKGELKAYETLEECFSYLADIVSFFNDNKKLCWIGFDPNGAVVIQDYLMAHCNIIQEQIIGVFQGALLQQSIKTIEQMLAIDLMNVNQSDLMNWQVANIKMNGRYFFEKLNKANKIDSCVAMAIGGVLINANPPAMREGEDLGLHFTYFED